MLRLSRSDLSPIYDRVIEARSGQGTFALSAPLREPNLFLRRDTPVA